MRASLTPETGGPKVVTVEDAPRPTVGPHGLLEAVFTGHLEPVVDSVDPLEENPAPHARRSNSETFGKVLAGP